LDVTQVREKHVSTIYPGLRECAIEDITTPSNKRARELDFLFAGGFAYDDDRGGTRALLDESRCHPLRCSK
jgi:hypothetical protein